MEVLRFREYSEVTAYQTLGALSVGPIGLELWGCGGAPHYQLPADDQALG